MVQYPNFRILKSSLIWPSFRAGRTNATRERSRKHRRSSQIFPEATRWGANFSSNSWAVPRFTLALGKMVISGLTLGKSSPESMEIFTWNMENSQSIESFVIQVQCTVLSQIIRHHEDCYWNSCGWEGAHWYIQQRWLIWLSFASGWQAPSSAAVRIDVQFFTMNGQVSIMDIQGQSKL